MQCTDDDNRSYRNVCNLSFVSFSLAVFFIIRLFSTSAFRVPKFGRQVSLRVHYCKRDEVYFTTLLRQNNGRQNGLISRMLFSELFKLMVNKVTFIGFRGEAIAPIAPLDPILVRGRAANYYTAVIRPITLKVSMKHNKSSLF